MRNMQTYQICHFAKDDSITNKQTKTIKTHEICKYRYEEHFSDSPSIDNYIVKIVGEKRKMERDGKQNHSYKWEKERGHLFKKPTSRVISKNHPKSCTSNRSHILHCLEQFNTPKIAEIS